MSPGPLLHSGTMCKKKTRKLLRRQQKMAVKTVSAIVSYYDNQNLSWLLQPGQVIVDAVPEHESVASELANELCLKSDESLWNVTIADSYQEACAQWGVNFAPAN